MTLVRKRESRKPQKAEGTYPATIIDVAERKAVATAYGVKDKIVITFKVDGETPIKRPYNDSLHPKSSLYALIREVMGHEPPQEYDLEELGEDVHRCCRSSGRCDRQRVGKHRPCQKRDAKWGLGPLMAPLFFFFIAHPRTRKRGERSKKR